MSNTLSNRKRRLVFQYETGRISSTAFENQMFNLEREPEGRAECPSCGSHNMFFHEHICGWKCTDCQDVQPSSRVKILEAV